MDDERYLSPEAVDVANRIVALDRKLDVLEQRMQKAALEGMRAPGLMPLSGFDERRDEREQEHQSLLAKRANLVERLKQLDGDA